MMEWIKHGIVKVVPQPDFPSKTEAAAIIKATAPPPAPQTTKSTTDTGSGKELEQQPNMMGWIVSGIGRMLPQPILKQEGGSEEVQTISISQKKTDLVLEDVEDDQAMKLKEEQSSKARQEMGSKDKEVDRLIPLMGSVKKETEEVILAHLEDRLQQERLEAARVAEEMARKAAEEAVRQLEIEQSAKIVIETLPESNELLPNILEEENEDDPESLLDVCLAEDLAAPAPETEKHVAPPSAPELREHVTPSSTDVEPASEIRDLESPASQQPKPKAVEAPPSLTEQTSAAVPSAGEEAASGVLCICAPIKGLLLRFPLAAEFLESFRKSLPKNNLRPLTLPPPPQLAQLTQQLTQLCTQAGQHCRSMARCFT
uniref:Cyclic nucleotide gated channel beta 1a n=1 Tax=Nothobranchius kadleci TaxID=1051664 RepID=A0A1A8CT63_NOTKA